MIYRHIAYVFTLLSLLIALSPFCYSIRAGIISDPARQVSFSFAPVIKSVAASVVNVYAEHLVHGRSSSPFANDPFFRHFFGDSLLRDLVPRERIDSSLGSGVIIDPSGVVVTNYHVIKNASKVRVALADKSELEVEVILKDEVSDLAIMQITEKGRYPFITMGDSENLEVGDIVLAIGNPFGVGQSVTRGIVSALARTQVGVSDYRFFIQTDAAINPGNSGGALIDLNGKLVGIPSAIYTRSSGSNGVGFAIPSAMVKFIVEQAKHGSTVRRPWFGADLQAISFKVAKNLGLKRLIGALVTNVGVNTPAMKAGLRIGDVIISIDGIEVSDPDAFNYRFSTKQIGTITKLRVLRGREHITIYITLSAAPELIPRDLKKIVARSPFQGATVANLSPAVSEELRLPLASEGVVIYDIERKSVAKRLGLLKGDIILQVNGTKISMVSSLEKIVFSTTREWVVKIKRGDTVLKMLLRV